MKSLLNVLLLLLIVVLSSSCYEDPWDHLPYPCKDGHCDVAFTIDTLVQPNTYLDNNGFHHIEFRGPKYFTILAKLDQLTDGYVLNGVPLVECSWDSDTWIAFDTLAFSIPVYNILGMSNGQNDPISVGNLTITMTDLAALHPPLNIAGYQINKASNLERLGTSTRYSYNSKQQFYLNGTMIGDTVKIFASAMWNTDVGPSEERNVEFNIVVDAYYGND
tara:strand:- start:15 stop:671 length:657 start_codon:yes stop_codon:yes gene_type:complete